MTRAAGGREIDPAALLLDARRARLDRVVAGRTRTLTVVLEHVHDPHNIAAVLRTCECFGVQELHVVEGPRSPYAPAPLVTQGAEKWLEVVKHKDGPAAVRALRRRGLTVLASRLSGAATTLPALPAWSPLALVFGNEQAGVSGELAAACDGTFVVPMFGLTQSLNISVAVGVTVSWLVLARAAQRGSPGDLPAGDADELRRRFYVKAVKQRGRIFEGKARGRLPRRYRTTEEEL